MKSGTSDRPRAPGNIEVFKRLKQHISIPLAVGEQARTIDKDGYASLPSLPGIGCEIDEENWPNWPKTPFCPNGLQHGFPTVRYPIIDGGTM